MNKLYLITGVSSGIGFSIAKQLLESKHCVVGVSRTSNEKINFLQKSFPKTFIHEAKDLTDDIDRLPAWVLSLAKQHGRFSGFVHSAGVLQILPLRFNSQKKMLEVFNINVFSALGIAQGIIDKRVNHGKGTSIVFISSVAAKMGSSGIVNYSASKSALNGAMRAMAKEVSPSGIRVNSILPGFINTELIDKFSDIYNEEYIQKMRELYPLDIGVVEDVACSVEYLLSEKSKWVTGTEMIVDGGITLGVHE